MLVWSAANDYVTMLLYNVYIYIGNYMLQEVLMKNHTFVWQNVYNTVSA